MTNETVFSLTELPAAARRRSAAARSAASWRRPSRASGPRFRLFEVGSAHPVARGRRRRRRSSKTRSSRRRSIVLERREECSKSGRDPTARRSFYEREGARGSNCRRRDSARRRAHSQRRGHGPRRHGRAVDARKRASKSTIGLQNDQSAYLRGGDVCFPYKFTHTADFTARIVIAECAVSSAAESQRADNALVHLHRSGGRARRTDENEAPNARIAVTTLMLPFADVDRAVTRRRRAGLRQNSSQKRIGDTILGATIVAQHAGEMISEITLAMTADAAVPGWKKRICAWRVASAWRRLAKPFIRTPRKPTPSAGSPINTTGRD